MEKNAIIEGKRYTVSHVFNAVSNWYFTDKNGVHYLVDGEDIAEWCDEERKAWQGIETAIAYARALARDNGGVFWWKEKRSN